MGPDVAGLVLLSALLHATWNTVVKSDEDHFLASFALVTAVGGLVAAAALFLVPPPTAAAWSCLGFSMVVHNSHYFCLLRSYEGPRSSAP